MALPPITNEQEHAAALDRIELLLEAEPGTPEGNEYTCRYKLQACSENYYQPSSFFNVVLIKTVSIRNTLDTHRHASRP